MMICDKVDRRLSIKSRIGRTLTLKIKYADFTQITRSVTFGFYISSAEEIFKESLNLLNKVDLEDRRIRLLGVTISNFYDADLDKLRQVQLTLF